MSLPKAYSKLSSVVAIIFGIFWLFACAGLTYLMLVTGSITPSTIKWVVSMWAMGVLVLVVGIIGLRQLKATPTLAPEISQFETDTAVTYAPLQQAAALQEGEVVRNWIGPVFRTDKLIVAATFVNKETNYTPENTLIFTNFSIIALMLAAPDLQGVDMGVIGGAVDNMLEVAPTDSSTKGVQFASFHFKSWGNMMIPLLAKPLNEVLDTHVHYAILYSDIASVEVKNGMFQPGFKISMKNGKTIKYSTLNKERLEEISAFLGTVVAVV